MGRTLAYEFTNLVDYFEIEHADHISVLDIGQNRVFAWMNKAGED